MDYQYKLDYPAIARNIKAARKQLCMTQAELAEHIEISTKLTDTGEHRQCSAHGLQPSAVGRGHQNRKDQSGRLVVRTGFGTLPAGEGFSDPCDQRIQTMPIKNRRSVERRFPFYLFSSSIAALADICSASFLLRPLPCPTLLPLRVTSTKKRLLWSGPSSPVRR